MHSFTNRTAETKQSETTTGMSAHPKPETELVADDNRPESIIQRRVQHAADNSDQHQQLTGLKALAENHAQSTVQLVANNTGMPDTLKSGVEQLSGIAMDDVKVHYNSSKPAELQAHAYAQGTDIHLAPGQEQHLPHEAWHVVQQKQGRVQPTKMLKSVTPVNDDKGLEREADEMGNAALQLAADGKHAIPVRQLRKIAGKGVVQRVVQALTRINGKWIEVDKIEEQEDDEINGVEPIEIEEQIEEDDEIIEPIIVDDQENEQESKDFYWIYDVIIGGRTPSPYPGTMGAHSTAWVVHVDTVRRQLVGTDLLEGAALFSQMAREELNSPLLKLEGTVDKKHQQAITDSKNALTDVLEALGKITPDDVTQENYHETLQMLRSAVNTYLTFVNFLPMSTVDGGDPSGHGEGAARIELNFFEYAAAAKHGKDQNDAGTIENYTALEEDALSADEFKGMDDSLKELLLGTIEEETLGKYRITVRNTLWAMFAKETPGVFAQSRGLYKKGLLEEVWALSLQSFLRSTRLAYPYAYDFARMQEHSWLYDDLKAMRIADVNLNAIIRLVTGEDKFVWLIKFYGFHPVHNKEMIAKIQKPLDNTQVPLEAQVRPDAMGASDIGQQGSGLQVTVLITGDGVIGDVVMQGRTKSPFSKTMGAHTTAWIGHTDAVTRALTGLTLPKAIERMFHLSGQEMKSDALHLSGYIDEKHQVDLVWAYNELEKLKGESEEKVKKDPGEMLSFLETFVGQFLDFVNLIPMSTIETGYLPNGRAEGMHRQFLKNYEEIGNKVFQNDYQLKHKADILRDHIMGLYDKHALNYFPPKLGMRENTNIADYVGGEDNFNKEHPLWNAIKIPDKKAKAHSGKIAFQRFLHTIEMAYPKSFNDSAKL
jgi:hypothetical protein